MRPSQKTALIAALAAGHPVTGAYSVDDATAAAEINAINVEQDVDSISGSDIFRLIPPPAYSALSIADRDHLVQLCQIETHHPDGPSIKAIRDIFGAGAVTSAVTAALAETVSVARQLGFRINKDDITEARI